MSQNPDQQDYPPPYESKLPPPPYSINIPPHGGSASPPPPGMNVYPPQPQGMGVTPQGFYPTQPQGMGFYPPQPQGMGALPQETGPQPQGMGAPDPTQPQVVINTQQVPMIVSTSPMGSNPVTMQCPSCRSHIQTQVEYEPTTNTHMMALILCLIGGLCCVWIPYCTDSCQGAKHTCPACGAYLGTYTN